MIEPVTLGFDAPVIPAAPDAFADRLLAGLVAMACRSKRRQADLFAVLRRSKLEADSAGVTTALAQLRHAGLIEEPVSLYDGGMLISITSQGMDRPGRVDQWAFLGRLGPLHS